ncbi:MAG: xanthine dehydrogenase, molybdenum binding subunit apoprotein [Deltaproteobacteria bacterium]|nr:xanthine dehydrogenase, molybdenum binding subunit apoprotein [Deltaproteobacteria bacterium]
MAQGTQTETGIGAQVPRREDRRLVTGHGNYVDDIRLPDMLHLKILRSPCAHARITRIDVTKARSLPGVVAVFTGRELHPITPPLPVPPATLPEMKVPEHHALAIDKVCAVGEGVAAVVATEAALAADALALIDVEYETLPAVVDPEAAVAPNAPIIHEQIGTNIAYRFQFGDVSESLAEADVVVRQRMENQRLIPNFLEPRGIVAQYDVGDEQLSVWVSTQGPHLVRTQLALMLNMPEHRIRVVAPDVGGGFGGKLNVYAEELLAVVLAKQLGRPVKWIEERSEHMVATSHGRGQVAYVQAAARRDGTLTALHLRIIADLGAYQHVLTPMAALQTATLITGCYLVRKLAVDITGAFTNKTPTDPYRGFGRAEGAYYIERVMDLIARELHMDPVEVRRRNFIPADRFPHTNPFGHTFDSGQYDRALTRALDMLGYEQFRREQARLRQEGRYLGLGLATYVWRAGFPSVPPGMPFLIAGWESASIQLAPTGVATVRTGTSPHGQGLETIFAQVVSDNLGLPLDDIRVVHGDTDAVQYGIGTMGSRSVCNGGSAVLLAAQEVRQKAMRIAAHALQVPPERIVFERGRMFPKGAPERALTLQEVTRIAYHGVDLPDGMSPGMEVTSYFSAPNFTSPFGTHACVVEVDVETGEVKIVRYITVDDCGRAINPLLVEGQVQGGVAQGVGQALLEGALYSEDGQPLHGSFLTYAMPTATELPMLEMDRTETPTPVNPLGAKGVGEAGTVGAPPAVVNAVVDALSPLGVTHIDMPLWPEKVWRAIEAAKRRTP